MPGHHHPFLTAWKNFNGNARPYLLKGDEKLLAAYRNRSLILNYNSFEEYVSDKNFGSQKGSLFHLGLLPIPFAGCLSTARIFILMLNPGFGAHDYFAEDYSTKFRRAILKTLHQKVAKDPFPMIYLNPQFAWHGGAEYWTGKLRGIICSIQDSRNISFTDALSVLSSELACIEHIPYHSRNSGLPSGVRNQLQSPRLAYEYVHDVLVPRAYANKAIIVATRSGDVWNLPKHKNIVVYSANEARAAHLTPSSRGGEKILKLLNEN